MITQTTSTRSNKTSICSDTQMQTTWVESIELSHLRSLQDCIAVLVFTYILRARWLWAWTINHAKERANHGRADLRSVDTTFVSLARTISTWIAGGNTLSTIICPLPRCSQTHNLWNNIDILDKTLYHERL